ncbi:zinc finger, CCHC-type containing protein [Tanacetum coccineum]
MGYENPIRTLEDFSKSSHEGHRNTIELPVGNNVDPNQHLKDFLKLVDSLDLDGENRERTRLRLFQFSLRDLASNWLERLPAGSITTWEDLTTRFLAQFFPPKRMHYYRSLLIGDEYRQDEGDRRGVRHLMRIEKEMLEDKEEVTNGYSKRKPKTTKPSTGWKRQSQSEAKVLENQLLSVSLLICLGKHDCVERIPSGDENPICTLGDYSKPSHEGYRNTIELPVGNNVLPLRSDTTRLVQKGCSFHGLRSEDPNQYLKNFLKLVDSLDLDDENRERTHLHLFQFSLRDQASNWLKRFPAGSITTWEDLTTRFLAQFFPPERTAKLRNDILMFQQHHGESLSEAWTRFKDLLQKDPHHGIDRWLKTKFFYDHVSFHLKCMIDRVAGGKLHNKNADESWEIIENLALNDHEGWTNTKEFVKPVKAISTPQGKSVSLGVDISNWKMFDDDWGLESKEVSPLGKELSLFDRPNEEERGRILEAHHLEPILQQQISQRMAPSHHDAFGRHLEENTRDLGSFREETNKTIDLHQHLSRISTQKLETTSQITRDAVTTHLKTALQDLKTVSKCYIDNLEHLGHPVTLGLAVSLIAIVYQGIMIGFVQNTNMHSLGRLLTSCMARLKLHEQTLNLPKNNAPALHAIRAGKVQKGKKHNKPQPSKAGRGQNQGNGKNKHAYAPKPKIPPPPKREDPAKDSICHECGETGHWKRNCPQYLAELLKKKKNAASGAGGGSGIFVIEPSNTFLTRSWIYEHWLCYESGNASMKRQRILDLVELPT